MITRVEDEDGNILHDCIAAGCAVSWDGEEIARDTAAPVQAAPPDRAVWDVRDDTARLRRDKDS